MPDHDILLVYPIRKDVLRIQNLFIVLILGSMQLCMCMRGIINRKQAEKPRPLDAPKVERVLNCVTELPAIGNLQVPRMRAVIEITSAESYNKAHIDQPAPPEI